MTEAFLPTPYTPRQSIGHHSRQMDQPHLSPANENSPLILSFSSDGGSLDDMEDPEAAVKAAKGRGLLCLVALLYGTLNVSLRLVYQLDEPPSAAALSATRGLLAALCFIPLLAFNKEKINKISTSDEEMQLTPSENTTRSLWVAGFELAFWNFLAQGLLNIGLLSTGSARASFLTQTSVVLTPIISLIAGQAVKSSVWAGCALALGGLTLLSGIGGNPESAAALIAFSGGDLLVLGGALSWSFYLFRLSKIGSRFNEINLQAVKTYVLAALYGLWLAFSVWNNPVSISWGWVTSITAWVALFYSALAPGTVADVLQQQGQKDVTASEANVILSMEPVFAALCAWLLLGETTSFQETIGGGLILLAALVATR